MKKIVYLVVLVTIVSVGTLNAQSKTSGGSDYNTALGLGVDFGDGGTGAGISAKHFFNPNNAGEADLLFFSGNVVGLGVFYEYHGYITNANGLKWYAGLGPQLLFGKGDTDFGARPIVGLDYKIPAVPLSFSFDWRPLFDFTNGSDFIAARFQLGFRYAF
jgi:hypothetical protein